MCLDGSCTEGSPTAALTSGSLCFLSEALVSGAMATEQLFRERPTAPSSSDSMTGAEVFSFIILTWLKTTPNFWTTSRSDPDETIYGSGECGNNGALSDVISYRYWKGIPQGIFNFIKCLFFFYIITYLCERNNESLLSISCMLGALMCIGTTYEL